MFQLSEESKVRVPGLSMPYMIDTNILRRSASRKSSMYHGSPFISAYHSYERRTVAVLTDSVATCP